MWLTPRQIIFVVFILISVVVLASFLSAEAETSVKTVDIGAVEVITDEKEGVNLTTTTTTTIPPPPPTTTTTVAPTTTTTTKVAPEFSDGVNWEAIAVCESSLGTGAPQWHINTGNGYYGGLQFSHSTWIAYGGGRYSENAHLTSRENQIAIASGMSLSHWPVCGRYG